MENIKDRASEREREEQKSRVANGQECPNCTRKWIRYRIRTKEWVCISCGETWKDTRNE